MKDSAQIPRGYKKALGLESFASLTILIVLFAALGNAMGFKELIDTLFRVAFDLLMNTCFYVMAIAVLAGALSAVMTEFGILAIINSLLSPLMRPIYRLPGAAAIGVVTTFLSDNPAILTLCEDRRFRRLFRGYELPALCNLGTAFGMGLIVTAYMLGLPSPDGRGNGISVLAGVLGAVVGSIVSTRLMILRCKKLYDSSMDEMLEENENEKIDLMRFREVRSGGVMRRLMDSLLEGGKSGVTIGLSIIPGVLVICSLILILTNSPGDKFPGIALIPHIGEKLNFILQPLFGFSSPQCLSVPLTSLGSAGAAIGLVPRLISRGLASANDLAVFTAICMCWSGYLATHVAMMDTLNARKLTGAAISSHTLGGLAAGIAAHWFYLLLAAI